MNLGRISFGKSALRPVRYPFFGDQPYALMQAPPISIARSLSLRRLSRHPRNVVNRKS